MTVVGLPRVAHADLGDEPSSKSSDKSQVEDNDKPKDPSLLDKKPADAAVAAAGGAVGCRSTRTGSSGRSRASCVAGVVALVFGGYYTVTRRERRRRQALRDGLPGSLLRGGPLDAPPPAGSRPRVRVARRRGLQRVPLLRHRRHVRHVIRPVRRDQRGLDDPGDEDAGERRRQRRLPDRPERQRLAAGDRRATWASSSSRRSPTRAARRSRRWRSTMRPATRPARPGRG